MKCPFCDGTGIANSMAAKVLFRRKARGLSQLELAKLCGVSHMTIAAIERGENTKVNTLMAVAAALECSVHDLLP